MNKLTSREIILALILAIKAMSQMYYEKLEWENIYIISHIATIDTHSMIPLSAGRGYEPPAKFSKTVSGDLRGLNFFKGELQFYMEHKLKSEKFNRKNAYKKKMFFSVKSNNLN